MKFFPLSIAILLSFIILIVAFQNLAAKTQYFLFLLFPVDNVPPFFIIIGISFLGTLMGIFYTLTVVEFIKEKNTSDDTM